MIKKFLTGILALTMAASCFAFTASAEELGDVDGSGTVDIEDAVIILGHINGQKALDTSAMTVADVDKSGEVDIEDVVAIISQINGVKVIVNRKASLEGLDQHLRDAGVITEAPKYLDPSYYSAKAAVEYPGAVTIVEYDKDSEGYQKLIKGELKAPDGSDISFQGYSQTSDKCFCNFFDYSDYDGAHNVEWQKKFLEAKFSYFYTFIGR